MNLMITIFYKLGLIQCSLLPEGYADKLRYTRINTDDYLNTVAKLRGFNGCRSIVNTGETHLNFIDKTPFLCINEGIGIYRLIDFFSPHSAGNLRQKIILVGRCTKELQNQFLSMCEFNGRFNPIYKD